MLIFSACFNAWLFGEMAVLVEKASAQASVLRTQVNCILQSAMNFCLPEGLKDDVLNFHLVNQATKREQEELAAFMDELSPSFQTLIAAELFGRMVYKSERLIGLVRARQAHLAESGVHFEEHELAAELAKRFELALHHPGSVILERLSEGQNLYFVYKGMCIARLRNSVTSDAAEPDPSKKTRRLLPFDFFGEISLYYNC